MPLTIYIRHDIAEILLKLELNANQYIQTFKTFMIILYSWSTTNYKTMGTCWVDHSLKGWRMKFFIETGLYRPRVKFFAMFEVVQHNLYSKHATKLMKELLVKTKTKGVVPMNRMILLNCKVTEEVVDRPSVLLSSFSLPSFP